MRLGSYGMVLFAAMAFAGTARGADDATSKKLIEYYRRKANVPPAANVEVKGELKQSPIKGAKEGTLSAGGRDVKFLISEDGKYASFGELEDLSIDPFAAVMKKIDLKRKPAKGPENAKVTIVEWSDFQCPFCTRGYQTIENQVLKEYGDKVRFIYKHFPLAFHPWAEPAAIATECMNEQKQTDAYWKLYAYYFENQKELNPQNLKEKTLEVLKGTKADVAKFTECFDGQKTKDIVRAEMAEGQSVGVTGTPGFIINGRLVSGAQPFENFKNIIDDELARAK